MAIQAPTHLLTEFATDSLHGLHRAVAFLALDIRREVPAVVDIDKVLDLLLGQTLEVGGEPVINSLLGKVVKKVFD